MCLLLLFSLLYSVAGAFFCLHSFQASGLVWYFFLLLLFSLFHWMSCLHFTTLCYYGCCYTLLLIRLLIVWNVFKNWLLDYDFAFLFVGFHSEALFFLKSISVFKYRGRHSGHSLCYFSSLQHWLFLSLSRCFFLPLIFPKTYVRCSPFTLFSEFRVANDLLKYIGVNPAAQQTHTRTGTQTRP